MVSKDKGNIPEAVWGQIEHIVEVCARRKPVVVVSCITYNHEAYLRDALEGFVMQQTDFPFVAVVHDDVSTDGTAAIIREYAERYPDIILPIYEEENQYSKGDGSLGRVIRAARSATGARYVALCEGDDYWIDPQKLQKQVDFMDSHEDYSMVATDAEARNADASQVLWRFDRYKNDSDIPIENLILEGGGYLATPTFMVRQRFYEEMPSEVSRLYVGDYALQIYMGYVGKVRYLNVDTAVYRWGSTNSWTVRNELISIDARKKIWDKHRHLLDVMSEVTEYKYVELFKEAWLQYLFYDYNRLGYMKNARRLWWKMKKPIKKYGWRTFINIHGMSTPFRLCRRLFRNR